MKNLLKDGVSQQLHDTRSPPGKALGASHLFGVTVALHAIVIEIEIKACTERGWFDSWTSHSTLVEGHQIQLKFISKKSPTEVCPTRTRIEACKPWGLQVVREQKPRSDQSSWLFEHSLQPRTAGPFGTREHHLQ